MTASIEAVLFDYGGVFTESPFAAVEEVGREIGAAPGVAMEIIFGPYDRDTDHAWHRLERGEISLEESREAILELGRESGLETDIYRFFGAMGQGNGVRQPFVDLIHELRRDGYRTAMITNNVREFREHWAKTLSLAELFDEVIDSSAVGMRKPDLAIFRHTLEQLKVAPENAVFLDDFEGNIRAAREAGLQAILVGPDYLEAIAELRRLVG